MTQDPSTGPDRSAAPEEKISPWKLTSGRILLLVMGALLLVYIASALMGGLSNYQMLKEASDAQRLEQQAPAAKP